MVSGTSDPITSDPLGPRWYFTSYMSYVLQNYDFFFHMHISKSAKHSLSFKNDVRFLDIR